MVEVFVFKLSQLRENSAFNQSVPTYTRVITSEVSGDAVDRAVRPNLIRVQVLEADSARHILTVRDMLQNRDNYPPRLLEERLVAPGRVHLSQLPCQPIVLSQEQCVHARQAQVLRRPVVTALEALLATSGTTHLVTCRQVVASGLQPG